VTDSSNAFLVLKASPNPDILCRFSRLNDDLPRLWLGSVEQSDVDETEGMAGTRQGAGRFLWEAVSLPPCCTHAPFNRGDGNWRLMFHLWRPRETGVLQSRVYLVRSMTDPSRRQWRYWMWWPEVALGISTKALEFTVPVNLNSCLRPLLMTTCIHAHRPEFAFDLRLNAGPATIYSIRVAEQEVEAQLRVQQGEAVLAEKRGSIRNLSIHCDLSACFRVVKEAGPQAGNLLICGEVDTGPWSGMVRMSEEHRRIGLS